MSQGITEYARMLVLNDDIKRLEMEKRLMVSCRNAEIAELRIKIKRLTEAGEKLARKRANGAFRRRWREINDPLLVEWLDATEGSQP
jgi:hypothetical protein